MELQEESHWNLPPNTLRGNQSELKVTAAEFHTNTQRCSCLHSYAFKDTTGFFKWQTGLQTMMIRQYWDNEYWLTFFFLLSWFLKEIPACVETVGSNSCKSAGLRQKNTLVNVFECYFSHQSSFLNNVSVTSSSTLWKCSIKPSVSLQTAESPVCDLQHDVSSLTFSHFICFLQTTTTDKHDKSARCYIKPGL